MSPVMTTECLVHISKQGKQGDLPETIKICDNAVHRLIIIPTAMTIYVPFSSLPKVLMYKILKQNIQDSSKIVKILPLFCVDL